MICSTACPDRLLSDYAEAENRSARNVCVAKRKLVEIAKKNRCENLLIEIKYRNSERGCCVAPNRSCAHCFPHVPVSYSCRRSASAADIGNRSLGKTCFKLSRGGTTK